jgi:hypothetical protein
MDMGFRTRDLWLSLILLIAALCLIVLFVLTAGCSSGDSAEDNDTAGDSQSGAEHEVPLTTLAQGANSEYGRFDEVPIPEDAPPECLIITDEEEYLRLISLAMLEEPETAVDFESEIVLAALQGPKNTGGYAISIMRASQNGGQVRVEVDVVEPEPGSMTIQVLTSPYHLVTAERSAFDPRGELVFSFYDQDDSLLLQQGAEI